MAINLVFSGADGDLVSTMAGMSKTAGTEFVRQNGAGGVKHLAYTSGTPADVGHDVGVADHYAQATLGSNFNGHTGTGPVMLRVRGAAATATSGVILRWSVSSGWVLYSGNTLLVVFGGTATAGDVIRLEVSGIVVTLKKNGATTHTYTLASNSGLTYAGFGGTSAVALASFITSFSADTIAPADNTAPTFPGSITVGAKTSSTIALTLPMAADNVGVAGYEYRIDGSAWVDNGASTAVSLSGLTALTSYTIDARAYDAELNYSDTLSVTISTYRAGASAGSIVAATGPQDGNPAGPLYALALTLPVDAWVSYRTVSGPTPSGGTLVAQPNGAFSYTGPAPAVWTIQPEINGVDHTDTVVVTLYDQGGGGDPEPDPDVEGPTWAGPISLVSRTTTTADLQLPASADNTAVTGRQYRVNGGAWQATAGAIALTGLTEATSYTVEARAFDAVPNYSSTISITFSTRSSVQAGPPTERWDGTQWVPGGVFRRGNGSGGFVTGGIPRRWTGTDWT